MDPEEFKLHFAELSAEYGSHLPAKLAELESLWHCLENGAASPDQVGGLKRELHTLVGTAKTMGFPAITDAAKAAQACLTSILGRGGTPDPAGREEFGRLFSELVAVVERSA